MHHMRRKSLLSKSLRELRQLRDDVNSVIRELEAGPRRDIDIALEFDGSEDRIAEVVDTRGRSRPRACIRNLRIYCSDERCSDCPHGPFLYEYWMTQKGLRIKFVGIPFIADMKILDRAMEKGAKLGLRNMMEDFS